MQLTDKITRKNWDDCHVTWGKTKFYVIARVFHIYAIVGGEMAAVQKVNWFFNTETEYYLTTYSSFIYTIAQSTQFNIPLSEMDNSDDTRHEHY